MKEVVLGRVGISSEGAIKKGILYFGIDVRGTSVLSVDKNNYHYFVGVLSWGSRVQSRKDRPKHNIVC